MKYIKVSDEELGDQHKCAACDVTQYCICDLSHQEKVGMGNCKEGDYHYKKENEECVN